MTDVLLCVGNSMMGDDGAGPLLAEMCAANPQGDWVVIDGGSAPENDVVAIRELRPDRLLIVDATDMGLNPGEIRLIDPDDIAEMFMMTTHNAITAFLCVPTLTVRTFFSFGSLIVSVCFLFFLNIFFKSFLSFHNKVLHLQVPL